MDDKKENNSLKEMKKLINVVSKLRRPKEGCPWDQEQTHISLIPYVLEEAHEVADAIRNESDDELKEELGDLLLQIVLHAQIAQEENRFDLEDIALGINQKLIRRHPHVFSTQEIKTIKETKQIWESIKLSEQNAKDIKNPISDNLKRKIRSQSSISGALEISKKAAKLGFEWKNFDDIWEKVEEELKELKSALNKKDFINAQDELGDVIFTLINIARWFQISAEEGLVSTNKRFLERFSHIESTMKGEFSKQSLNDWKEMWDSAKKALNVKQNNNSI